MAKRGVIQAAFGGARPSWLPAVQLSVQSLVRSPLSVFRAPVGLLSDRRDGQPLPPVVLRKMERLLGADFSNVRVHIGREAPMIRALAFTAGSDLYFAPGRYQPHTASGHALLGHELAHVVQQRAGRVPLPSTTETAIVYDEALEAEADRIGALAATAQPRLDTAKKRG